MTTMRELLKNQIVKNILSALAVAFFGLILLNLTFLFDALYQGVIMGIVRLFMPLNPDTNIFWLPGLFHGSFVVVIGIISWFVFRTKLRVLYKAIYMTVPVAVVLATVGILFYQWQIITYSVGGLLCIGTLYYFYRTKQPWLYYYTLILVSLTLAIYTLTGGEI
jgi:hypothetical protein